MSRAIAKVGLACMDNLNKKTSTAYLTWGGPLGGH